MTHSYHDITTAPVRVKLEKSAENPYNLTREGALTDDKRVERYVAHTASFKLMYSTQRINDSVLNSLQQLADECGLIKQFAEMRRGAVLNKIHNYDSECRQVLHTSCRDIFSDSPKEANATGQARVEIEKLRAFLDDLDSGKIVNEKGKTFTTMVTIGIGGSDLGPRSIYEALKAYSKDSRVVHFIANVDPDDAARVLEEVDLSRALVNIVSKSGTTLETLTNESIVVERLLAAGLNPAKHCLAVTGQGSPMDNPQKYLRSFYMFDYIGGRYSSTSMVGAVMLGFSLGVENLDRFLHGASTIDDLAENAAIQQNIPLLLALLGVWNHNFLGMDTVAILPYSQALHRFPAHLQQCDMESNGKSINRQGQKLSYKTGPVVWGEPGTNGQHAFYQLLHQGTEIVPAEFIGFRNCQYQKDLQVSGTTSQQKLMANMLAQSIAMATGQKHENPNKVFSGNRPTSILLADKLTPETMGELLAIYEAKIIFQGFLWNINSFDQEGVQLGKILAGRILEQMQARRGNGDGIETQFLDVAENTANTTVER
ncbi:glucose-6-phosphate isomerase [Desulfosediminicola flagellatus]|uniref:glucose-6-phosphate isomerase n=1 Tax=Desulfosediminicola flagellatus TaxID=2569541 RepID=UPI0010AB8113|nr:glucose-6-phosphate isomerase [Desulfosediminicola flagellatus]